jgi:hypothetical protein
MAFRLVHARYHRETERAFVELRDADDDGGEIVATAILSYRMVANSPSQEINRDIVRKARHVLKRAAAAT